jgi:outer membrane protein insertion porin family
MRNVFLAVITVVHLFSVRSVSARPQPEPTISRIEFVGLRRIPAETLRSRIASRVGEPLDHAQIAADVRALERLGWFDSIRVKAEPAAASSEVDSAQGLRLEFEMEECPFLAGVEFRGSRILTDDRAQSVLGGARIALPVAKPVNRADLFRASRLLEHSLNDLGYPMGRVRLRLVAVPTAAVRAVFEIDDGPRINVAHIKFSGDHAFPEEILRRQMKRAAPAALLAGLRDKSIYTSEGLEEERKRLENFYHDHGYAQARVAPPEVQILQDPVRQGFLWLRRRNVPRFHITIPVDEGIAYRFGRVWLEGDSVTAGLKERLAALPEIRALRAGGSFSQEKVDRARDTVKQVMAHEWRQTKAHVPSASRSDSLLPEVDAALKLDPDERAVHVTLSVRQEHPYVVRRLEFSGQRRFRDRYYRRHIGLVEGDAFDAEKIESGLAQLAREGYIRPPKKEDLSVRLDEARHTADLAVRIEELGRQKISFVGGHSALGNTAGIVYNLFGLLGGEELLTGHLECGPESLEAILRVTEEAIFGTRISFGLSVFQNVVRPSLPYAGRRQHLFTSRSAGLTLAAAAPLSETDTLGFTYSVTQNATQYHLPLPAEISGIVNPSLSASATNHSLGWHFAHDSRRDRLVAESSVSGGWLGGTTNQIHPSADYVRRLPDHLTQERNTWVIRGAFAGTASFRGDLPYHDRLFAGDDYVRGFRTGELGPYAVVASHDAGGNDTFHAQSSGADLVGAVNTEYRMPVAPRTEIAPFFDSGAGWLLPNWIGPQRPTLLTGTNGVWRTSTGVELRWQIPRVAQLLRVHFAVNPMRLTRALELPDGSRFHVPDRLLALGWALGSPF